MFRELLANIVKHSNATEIFIHFNITQNNFNLNIEDNGTGVSMKAIEESKGIGWKNIFARINMLKGNISIEQNETAGNTVQIQIPIA